MHNESIIVVTGAAGFIGSCLTGFLNTAGYNNLILVDDFSQKEKNINLAGKKFMHKIEREIFFDWLAKENPAVAFVYHIGARTDTTEFDYTIHEHLNVAYSKSIWKYCAINNIPLVYASSAATYGAGEAGYKDDEALIENLKPLNPYGVSKNEFDKWALQQAQNDIREETTDEVINVKSPPAWAGLKFFNVYGPNEYHKGRMASVIFHSCNQIANKGFVKLFKSHKKEFKDGEQLRDFIYVKDVLTICFWFLEEWNKAETFTPGIYNVGTGKARTFNDLVKATFTGLDKQPEIQYINMPEDIRDTYQYYTQATMQKIQGAGYNKKMFSLEEGVDDYVRKYLSKKIYY